MQGHNVALRHQRVEVDKALRAFRAGPGRVAQQHAHAQQRGRLGDLAPHVAHTHDAQRQGVEPQAVAARQRAEHGGDVLLHRRGIATRRVAPEDPVCFAPRRVDVVVADRGRGHDPHGRAREQRRIATGARARHDSVRVADHRRGRLRPGQVNDLGPGFKNAPDEGNLVVADDLHAPPESSN